MQIKPDEITSILRSRIEGLDAGQAELTEVGTVLSVADGIARIHGVPAWHTWRLVWDDAGMRFYKDYVDGAAPYYNVPAHTLPDWQFNDAGYQMFPVFDLAVAGSGGGDPRGGSLHRLGRCWSFCLR